MSGLAKFQAYLLCCSVVAAWLYFYVGVRFNHPQTVIYIAIIGGILYLPLGGFLSRLFQSRIDSKANQAYDNQQRNEQERQRNQRLEDKRQELAIEFDHLQKIMFLQANLDQGKLDKLQSMQTALKTAKSDDLDTLRRQIETMKRG